MGIPRFVDQNFTRLGATKFLLRTEADEPAGLEQVIEPWMEAIGDHIKVA
jgi:hypothetical protein